MALRHPEKFRRLFEPRLSTRLPEQPKPSCIMFQGIEADDTTNAPHCLLSDIRPGPTTVWESFSASIAWSGLCHTSSPALRALDVHGSKQDSSDPRNKRRVQLSRYQRSYARCRYVKPRCSSDTVYGIEATTGQREPRCVMHIPDSTWGRCRLGTALG